MGRGLGVEYHFVYSLLTVENWACMRSCARACVRMQTCVFVKLDTMDGHMYGYAYHTTFTFEAQGFYIAFAY